ncbi:hypothetical protein SETIT_9G116900v2 [Setaria italica]|uniref:Uncharacterized protein n=2 Tax=Setaria italica TaxID=4555 RepID=A0A368SFJ4_SETIT|nr:hypothetical protein SETIT_9G116900v2 [Setaria italica]
MVMKRPAVLAALPLLLAICFVLFQAADGSRASPPEEPWEPAVPHHPVLRDEERHRHQHQHQHVDEELHQHVDEELHQHLRVAEEAGTRLAGVDMEGAEGRAVRADGGGAAPSATTSARREDQGGAAKLRSAPPPLRLKLARRAVAGAPPVEGAERRAVRAHDGEDQGGAVKSRHLTASSSRSPPPPLRSADLARRVLAGAPAPPGEGAVDSAARSSCHSSDVHVGCPPHQ